MLVRTSNNWLPQVFNEIFGNDFIMPRTMSNNTPAINIIDRKDAYEVQLAAPGMTREDFKVTLNEEENLVIEIEKKVEVTDTNKDAEAQETERYLRREFTYTKFSKTLLLPEDVNREAITASAQDGVLYITLPKLLPEEQKREVKEIAIN